MGCCPNRKQINPVKHIGQSSQSTCTNLKIYPGLYVRQIEGNPYNNYTIITLLGKGTFGKVYKVMHTKTQVYRAMKVINKYSSNLNKENEEDILREISILMNLDHPNIIKVFEFYNSHRDIFIITELCTGGELFDRILEIKYFSEDTAAHIMKQLLSAVSLCHSHNIVHRDLKPENILIESNEERNKNFFSIKIIDFGTSLIHKRTSMMKTITGTSYYIAPEVLHSNYNEKCDLWSCGVIMYILLCGKPPFNGASDNEIYSRVSEGEYYMDEEVWKNISYEAKDLMSKLLEKDIKKRLSAKDALQHEWFSNTFNPNSSKYKSKKQKDNFNSVIGNLKSFHAERKFQHAVLGFIIHNLAKQEDIAELRKVFLELDENGDGRLSKQELLAGLSKIMPLNEAEYEVGNLINSSENEDGYIEYQDFLKASYNKEKLLNINNLKLAFDMFDKDGNGLISVGELKSMLGNNGIDRVQTNVWNEMIREIDLNGDGEISFEEFQQIMCKILEGKSNDKISV